MSRFYGLGLAPAELLNCLAVRTHDEDDSPALAPGLYVVGTPIGNLEDITLRALRVLRHVDLIACEDTRHTQKLLNHFGIKAPTQSYHEHNETSRAEELVERIRAGARIAVVSDAGMPGISDPGEVVIRAAIERGLPVVVVPGPSALISALVGSGIEIGTFRFVGFLPSRSGERRTVLESLKNASDTLVFYEAPHRLLEALRDLESAFGSNRQIVIARELTKIHEEFLRGTVAEVAARLAGRESTKGEITIVVAAQTAEINLQPTEPRLADRMRALISEGLDEKAALKQVAREYSLSKSEAYREWQRTKRSRH